MSKPEQPMELRVGYILRGRYWFLPCSGYNLERRS
jgi:hypothetical protein